MRDTLVSRSLRLVPSAVRHVRDRQTSGDCAFFEDGHLRSQSCTTPSTINRMIGQVPEADAERCVREVQSLLSGHEALVDHSQSGENARRRSPAE